MVSSHGGKHRHLRRRRILDISKTRGPPKAHSMYRYSLSVALKSHGGGMKKGQLEKESLKRFLRGMIMKKRLRYITLKETNKI